MTKRFMRQCTFATDLSVSNLPSRRQIYRGTGSKAMRRCTPTMSPCLVATDIVYFKYVLFLQAHSFQPRLCCFGFVYFTVITGCKRGLLTYRVLSTRHKTHCLRKYIAYLFLHFEMYLRLIKAVRSQVIRHSGRRTLQGRLYQGAALFQHLPLQSDP